MHFWKSGFPRLPENEQDCVRFPLKNTDGETLFDPLRLYRPRPLKRVQIFKERTIAFNNKGATHDKQSRTNSDR